MQSSPEKAAITPVYLATSSEVMADVTQAVTTQTDIPDSGGLAMNYGGGSGPVSAQALVSRGLATLNEMIVTG